MLTKITLNPDTEILIVEDNPTNFMMAKQLLNKFGLRKVDHALNGVAALERLEGKKYDLILMDCQMPEMDGYEATAKIRKKESRQNQRTPILAMTANTRVGDREKCLASGMDDYIGKPLIPDAFQALLNRWIKKIAVRLPEDQPLHNVRLFTNTKIPEDDIKEILNIDAACNAP